MKYPRRFRFKSSWRGLSPGAPYSLRWYDIIDIDYEYGGCKFINDAGRPDGITYDFPGAIFQYDNDIIDALLEKYA